MWRCRLPPGVIAADAPRGSLRSVFEFEVPSGCFSRSVQSGRERQKEDSAIQLHEKERDQSPSLPRVLPPRSCLTMRFANPMN